MITIFVFSGQQGTESGGTSRKFTVAIDFGSASIKGMMGIVTESGCIQQVATEIEPSCGSISCGKVKNIEQASGLLRTMMKKLKNKISKITP